MKVTTTPNVDAAVLADPVLAVAIEAMRRDGNRTGYLHLYRSNRRGPFEVVYYCEGHRSTSSSLDLITAMIGAVENQETAA